MKRILAISGSASENSSNVRLLHSLSDAFSDQYELNVYDNLRLLPMFTPEELKLPLPVSVSELKEKVGNADAVIISTPEYLHNIPAVLKNSLEWLTESGEWAEKPVLAITFTPAAPRGELAMRSLTHSLQALQARVVAELPLYRNEFTTNNDRFSFSADQYALLQEALSLL